jgi:hypothetical protein
MKLKDRLVHCVITEDWAQAKVASEFAQAIKKPSGPDYMDTKGNF